MGAAPKRGRPLLLGEELDQQVQAYLLEYRRNATAVDTTIVIGCAQGLVKDYDSNLLEANGGPIALTKSWAKYLLSRMGFVKRRASTKGKKLATDFHELKAQFLFDIKAMIEMEEIPQDLVINWDQTGIHYVPVSSYTMEKEGAKRVELVGIDDKRQITAVFCRYHGWSFLTDTVNLQGKDIKMSSFCRFSRRLAHYLHGESLGKREYYDELFGKNSLPIY